MLIVIAAALAATTEALRGPPGLHLSPDEPAGNATAIDSEPALFVEEKHFLSEVELQEYLDEAVSGRQPPPASHPVRSVKSSSSVFMSRVETTWR